MTPLLTALLAYALVLVAVGAWAARRSSGAQSFFVSDRSLGAGLLGATLLAANIGASATVGATHIAYTEGPAAWWWSGSAGIGSLILAWTVGPRIWREARARGFLTVGDFIAHHYGPAARNFSTLVIWLAAFLILSAQLIGAGEVLAAAGHFGRQTGCVLAAAIMTLYFVSGGLRSAARVNVLQLVIKIAGFALAAPILLAAAGGLDRAIANHPAGQQFLSSGNLNAGWPALFLTAPAFLFSPGILQKIYGARDERAVRFGVGWNAVGLLLFACLPVLLGLAARTIFPALERGDQALPRLMAESLPAWLGGLALAAVFSAEMSAGDAVLFMLSTSGARDVYRGLIRPAATERDVLGVARVIAALAALIGLALTYHYDSVVAALGIFYALLGATLAGPIIGGLYRPAGARGALLSMMTGVSTTLAAHVGWLPRPAHWTTPAFMGLAVNLAVYFLAGLASGRTVAPPRK